MAARLIESPEFYEPPLSRSTRKLPTLPLLHQFLNFAADASASGNGASFLDLFLGVSPAELTVVNVMLVLAGMLFITKGGDIFTDAAVAIARATRIPPVIIGATIVSIATTFPEFMVSLTGALAGKPGFAVGNALGSCCCNIGLIVGTCALIKGYLAHRRGTEPGIPVNRLTLMGPGAFMLIAGTAVWGFGFFDKGATPEAHGIARWQAGMLIALLVVYIGYSLRMAFQARFEADLSGEEEAAEDEVRAQIGKQVFGFLIGAGLVVLGSRLMVANAAKVALEFGVSELVVGLTVLAIGTSLPEYTISLLAVIKGHGALGIGNIFGANILNICWVVASCALIGPLPIQEQTLRLDGPVVLLLMLTLIALSWKNQRVSIRTGAILFAIYCVYLVVMIGGFAGP